MIWVVGLSDSGSHAPYYADGFRKQPYNRRQEGHGNNADA